MKNIELTQKLLNQITLSTLAIEKIDTDWFRKKKPLMYGKDVISFTKSNYLMSRENTNCFKHQPFITPGLSLIFP